MPTTDMVVSDLNLGDVIEQPANTPEPIRYEDTVVVPPQDLNDDIITLSIKDDELPDAVLKAVLLGFAEEQMALRKLRQKKEVENKDIDHISIKRSTVLKFMSDTLIQRQALVGGGGEIDLKGPKFREIFKMFLNTISDTFDEIKIPSEYKDLFFQALSHNLDGWEIRAEKIVRTIH